MPASENLRVAATLTGISANNYSSPGLAMVEIEMMEADRKIPFRGAVARVFEPRSLPMRREATKNVGSNLRCPTES